jgi:hypothetical protein
MNKRNDWTFTYKVNQVVDAANAKINLHQGRLNYWTEQHDIAKQEVKDSTEVREYDMGYTLVSNKLSTSNLQPVCDVEKTRRYAHCIGKMQEHMDKIAEFKGFFAALSAQDQDSELSLTVNDVLYFGLGENQTIPEEEC